MLGKKKMMGVYSVHLGQMELARFYAANKKSARRKLMKHIKVRKER